MTESMRLPTHEQRMKYFDDIVCKRSGGKDSRYYIACYLFVSLVFELPPDDDTLKDPGLANLCSRRLKEFIFHISKINWPVNDSVYMKYLDDCKYLIAEISALGGDYSKRSIRAMKGCKERIGGNVDDFDSEDFIVVGSILSESRSRDSSPKRVPLISELPNPTSFKCFVKFHDSTVVRCLTMSHKPSRLITDRLATAWKVCRQHISYYLSKVIIPEEFIEMVKNHPEIVDAINNFNTTQKAIYMISVFDYLAALESTTTLVDPLRGCEATKESFDTSGDPLRGCFATKESQNDWFYQLYMILHAVDEPIASFMYIVILELESKNLTHMLDYQLKDLIHIFMKRSFERIQEFISPEYVNAILELQSSMGV